MIITSIALASLALAAVPTVVHWRNLRHYRPLDQARGDEDRPRVSVLIPARNERRNIGKALRSVLDNEGVELEVLVLDDHSRDGTGTIVEAWAAKDRRVRLLRGAPLPKGANGKQNACDHLARHARHPVMVFMDADVRLSSDALARMASFMKRSGARLISGIPRQRTESFGERLLLPLIHFVLLAFLPLWRMRRSTHPAYAAGVGQLFMAERDAYWAAGGHGSILSSRHDGLDLPRIFRQAGFATDLFDATDVAECRMYESTRDTWYGLLKNADQGLGRPGLIVPASVLLLGGQVIPWVVLLLAPWVPVTALAAALGAIALSLTLRAWSARRFAQTAGGAILHPLGVAALVAIQWHALARRVAGRPARWKGRSYAVDVGSQLVPPAAQGEGMA